MTKIAIQGVHGCFHEQAARLFYGNEIGVCECLSFEDLFVALDQGKASGAIMAIENTVAGDYYRIILCCINIPAK